MKSQSSTANKPLLGKNGATSTEDFGDFQQAASAPNGPTTPTGKQIALEIPPAPGKIPAVTTIPVNIQDTAAPAPIQQATEFCLKFSGYLTPFYAPDKGEIALVAYKHFQQEGMIVREIWSGSEKIYKFTLRTPVPKDGQSLQFPGEAGQVCIPLYTWENKRKERKEGTLLTFRQAGEGALGYIPATEFDKAILALNLQLIIPTKLQRVKGAPMTLNGNRFCVIETPKDLKQVPASISLRNPVNSIIYPIQISFFGQEVFCYRCGKHHVGKCPELQAFYAAQEERNAMVKNNGVRTKIFGDSTVRHMDPLGTRSDICAMSGGGLGQVIQASLDDPKNISHDTNIIIGGSNDIKIQNFPATEQFAANIDGSLEKLAAAAVQAPDRAFVLVQQKPEAMDEVADSTSTEEDVRVLYLRKRMFDIAEKVENIQVVDVRYQVDETGHPTKEGTFQILNDLNEKNLLSEDLIWNKDYLISDRPYRRLQAIYRYGCNICANHGTKISRAKHSHPLLCDECTDKTLRDAANVNRDLQDIVTRLNSNSVVSDRSFPPSKRKKTIGDSTNSDDMEAD